MTSPEGHKAGKEKEGTLQQHAATTRAGPEWLLSLT